MHCLWSFSEVVLILKLATDQLAFSVSGKICFMSGFNQTGCSKLEIFLTEVTFICVWSQTTYLIMVSITVSAKFSSISIIYISVVLTSVSVFYHFLDSYRLKLKCPYTFQFSCFCSSKNETLQGWSDLICHLFFVSAEYASVHWFTETSRPDGNVTFPRNLS